MKKLIAWIMTGLLGLTSSGSVFAYFHLWQINEIYSNADGSVQFIELLNLGFDGETVATAAPITVTPTGGTARTFNFPSNLSGSTANKSLLIATQGFANLGVVTPDFIMQDGFVAINGGQMNLGGFDIINYLALPTNGILSINPAGVAAVNSPSNFAGASGSVYAAEIAGVTAALDAFKALVNSNSSNLAYTHLLPAYDASFLAGGVNATTDAKVTASDLRGGSITAFTITKVNSYDAATGIINVAGTISGVSSEGPFTDYFDGIRVKVQVHDRL